MHNKKALTLLEILVSALILALVMTGLANIFLTGKRYILRSRARMTGGELGKLFLDPLQMAVRQDTWNQSGNFLNTGTTYCDNDPAHSTQQNPACPSQADRTLDRIEYSAEYNTTSPFPNSEMRKVVTTVRWTEPSP